jgi:hypothetical protein
VKILELFLVTYFMLIYYHEIYTYKRKIDDYSFHATR